MTRSASERPAWFPADRLFDVLDSSPQTPLVVLWTWPGGGARDWLSALEGSSTRAHFLTLEEAEDLGSGELGLLAEPPAESALEQAVSSLRAGARLVVAGSPKPAFGLIKTRLFSPRELRLDAEQLKVAASTLGSRALDSEPVAELIKLTGGWVAPARWLLQNASPELPMEQAFRSSAFQAFLDQTLIPVLSGHERKILGSYLAAPVTLPVWRQMTLGSPSDLAALEALSGRWGLIDRHAPPPLLSQVAPEPLDRDSLLRRLAVAANSLDQSDHAAEILSLAGVSRLGERRGPEADTQGPEPQETVSLDAVVQDRALQAPGSQHDAPSVGGGAVEASRSRRSAQGPRFRVRLFGSPTVARLEGEGRESEISWRLHRSLLAVARLALAPDYRLSREELIETLWPSTTTDHVRRNFHPTMSCARKALGGRRGGGIVFSQGTYRLDPQADWQIDVHEFERCVARAKEASAAGHIEIALDVLQEAWRLYRGPLLIGHDGEWLEPRREWMHRRYLGMLELLGQLAARTERDTLALDAFRSLLIEEPFEERIHLSVMEIYGQRGRRDLVRRQFVRLQELLKDLHVEPAEETIDRYHQLMG